MPQNCPLQLEGPCDGCPKLSGDKCAWHFPPMPLRELLTDGERLDMLEAKVASFEFIVPSKVLSQHRKELNDIKGQLTHNENKLNEHIDAAKKKAKKRTGTGAVEV